MPPASNPIEGLARRLDAALAGQSRLLVAVSGGSDSTALLRLLAGRPGRRVVAATVDHGLRPGSRAEAEAVGAWCRTLGVPHRILTWEGEKPATGVQAAARAARYALLASAAAEENCPAIVTGHTADDQAETVFMRLSRGSGAAGLSAMSAASLIAVEAEEPVVLLRPLLGERRAVLRAFLHEIAQPFHEDPSNDDPRFERIRVRALLGALEEQDLLSVEALRRTAARLAQAAADAERRAQDDFVAAGGWFHALGPIVVDRPDMLFAAAWGLAARLIHAVSGEDHAPDEDAAFGALGACDLTGAATLGGALLRRDGRRLVVMREPSALLGRTGVAPAAPLMLDPGARRLWDNRFIVANRGPAPVAIRPLADAARLGARRALHNLPADAFAAVPEIAFDGGAVDCRSIAAERFGALLRFRKL